MKKYFLSSVCTSLCIASIHAAHTASPNIVVFLVDDMGWQDTSLPFYKEKTPYNRFFETPNMERLAAQGMKFTSAYACSVSSPTRCSLMTGMNAARHRVTNWTLFYNQNTDAASAEFNLPEWNVNGIQPDTVSTPYNTYRSTSATTLPQILRENGYYTIHCGKAHFGSKDTPGADPLKMGFDKNIAGSEIGGPASYLAKNNFGSGAFHVSGLEKYYGSDLFLTECLTREAISAMEKPMANKQPFYLYMAHYAVHIPIDKDIRFYEKYLAKGVSPKEAAYAALVEGMDKSLGDIMDWLEKNGEMQNTVFIFMSDNGGLAASPGHRSGKLHTQNSPLKSGKGSLHEGGIREPMIVSWPGVVKEGTSCDTPVIIEDFFPSILELAGVKRYKTIQTIDGVSFVPLLKQKKNTKKNRCFYWNYPNSWGLEGPGINLNCAVRYKEWKLIYSYATGKKELYHIKDDIEEQNELSQQYPEIINLLSKKLGKYLRSVEAQRPTVKKTGKFCLWPDEV